MAISELKYDKGLQEYQFWVGQEHRTHPVSYHGQNTVLNALPMLMQFVSKKEMNEETEKPKHVYWRTNRDEIALKVIKWANDNPELVSIQDVAKELLLGSTAKVDSRATDHHIIVPRNSEGYVPYGYQKAGIAYLLERWKNSLSSGVEKHPLLADAMGLGKEQPVDQPVLTPTGWRKIGDLTIGDPVIGRNGNTYHVKGVFPQGKKLIYRVRTTDGGSCECGEEHLWTVTTSLRKSRGSRPLYITKTLRELIDSGLTIGKAKNNKYRLPICEPIEYPHNDLFMIDPWVLGAIIGDGCLLPNGRKAHNIQLTTSYPEIEGAFLWNGNIPEEDVHRGGANGIQKTLRGRTGKSYGLALETLGLMGKRSHEKFIPEKYMFAPIHDRRKLLAGLLDTDGSVAINGAVTFFSTSEDLAKDVQQLVWGLGGVGRISCQGKRYKMYKGKMVEHRAMYRVGIIMPDGINPFRHSKHKRERFDSTKSKTNPKLPVRSIVSATPIGIKESVCISVTAPDSLYITKDYIVTHNTAQVACAALLDKKVRNILIVCPTILKENWRRELFIWLCTGDKRFCEASTFHEDGWKIKRNLITIIDSSMRTIPKTQIWIINYDLLKSDRMTRQIMTRCEEGGFDLIVGDEVQDVKNPKSQRSKAFYRLYAPRKVAMTGTPIDKPGDVQAIAGWLFPRQFSDRIDFRYSYCRDRHGAERLGTDLRRTIMIARSKEQVASDLPPYIKMITQLEPSSAKAKKVIDRQNSWFGGNAGGFSKALNDVDRQFKAAKRRLLGARTPSEKQIAQLDMDAVFARVAKAQQMLGSIPFDQLSTERAALAEEKIPYAKEAIQNLLDSGKESIVVFYHHRKVAEALKGFFKEKAVIVDGKTNAKVKQDNIDYFMSGKVPIFLGSIRAANAGINLQRSDYCLFIERDWNDSANRQAEDRIHRQGQRFPCTSNSLLFKGSLDALIFQIGAIKYECAQMMMNAKV